MCTGLEIAAIAAAVGSTGATYMGQRRAEKKQKGFREAENIRQDALQSQAANIFGDTLDKSGADETKRTLAELQGEKASEAEGRVKSFKQSDYLPGQTRSNVIRSSAKKTIEAGDASRKTNAGLAAILDAYNDVRTGRNIAQKTSGQGLDQLSSFASGSAKVGEQEIAAAANDTGFWGVLAPILSGVSSAAGGISAAPTATAGASAGGAISNPNIPGAQYLLY